MTPEELAKINNETFTGNPNAGFNPTAPITGEMLNGGTTQDYQQAPPVSVPSFGVDATTQNTADTLGKTEQQTSDLGQSIIDIQNSLLGRTAFTQEQNKIQGYDQLISTQNDLNAQIQQYQLKGVQLQNEANIIPSTMQEQATGRGITAAGLQPLTAGELRKNALAQSANASLALTTQAALYATQGKLTTAKYLVDQAVAAKYGAQEEELATKKANLEILLKDPKITLEQKKRGQAQLDIQNAKEQALADEKQRKTDIWNIATTIAPRLAKLPNGGAWLNEIQNAETVQDAFSLAFASGGFTEEEVANTQVLKLDNGNTMLIDTKTGNIIANFGGAKPTTPTGIPTEPIVSSETGQVLEYGTPEYMIERLKKTASSKTKPVASEREQLGKFANVIALTGSLMSSLSKTTNDPILGYLRGLNPYDFDARAINAQVTALVPSAARALYGEVGVLTDSDIERYLKTLPNLRSTEQQNKFIAAMTLKNAMRSYEQTLLNLANSNVNVSGFVDSYKAISDQVAKLESELGIGASSQGLDSLGVSGADESIFDQVSGSTPSGGEGFFSNLLKGLTGK